MPNPPPANPPEGDHQLFVKPQGSTKWKNWIWIALGIMIVAFVFWPVMRRLTKPFPEIPFMFVSSLPANCRQVVLVLSPNASSVSAQMWLLDRTTADDDWSRTSGPIPVSLGRNGLAWGDGEHSVPPPSGFPEKQEGDGCSPAGVFQIPFAFGYSPADEARMVRLRYVHVTESLAGVDDVKSKFYNQVVDASTVTKDWESNETMLRPDGLYRWGAFIAHNPRGEFGRGSCIFFHLWNGPGRPTAGCTAMEEKDVIALLSWLDPAKEPRLVQSLENW
jgi:L,D-peptidoglycan transpeptidase YkuD (ErfK/YbiS/YcfS/YnhG family)